MADPTFKFDKSSQRYRFKTGDRAGQFVSQAKVRELIQARISKEEKRIERITVSLLNGGLTLPQWEDSMAKRIKELHIQSYLLGRGGVLQYDAMRDRQVLNPIIQEQYIFLRRFSEAIKAGDLTEGQIKERARLYAGAAWQMKERGSAIAHSQANYLFERNVLGGEQHVCTDCEYLTFIGVVSIGRISQRKPPGSRICLGNCRCHIEYYKERPAEAERAIAQSLRHPLSFGLSF